jgi:predicted HicB family RNase H-like nuclease
MTISRATAAYLERQKSDTWRMAKGKEKRTERFSMRMPPSIHKRLVDAADGDHRSMTDIILIALEKHLNALDSQALREHEKR